MRLFKRHVCPPGEIREVHVPCVPASVELKHTYSPRPRARRAYIETRTDTGMPLRGNPVTISSSEGPYYTDVLIPKPGGGFERQSVYLFLEF